jgi:hypothetical protein
MNKYQGQAGSIILLNMAYTSEKAINNNPLAFTLDLGWGLLIVGHSHMIFKCWVAK